MVVITLLYLWEKKLKNTWKEGLIIGNISIGGQSMEGGSGIFGMCNNYLISSTSVLALVCVEINDEDYNSQGSNEFGG